MNRRTAHGVTASLLALSAGAMLAGCSQIEALAPVGGDRATEIRFATIELLLDHDIDVLEAPTCTEADDKAVHCTGTTVGGEVITADSLADDQANLTVRVDDEVLYDGSIADVIEEASRP